MGQLDTANTRTKTLYQKRLGTPVFRYGFRQGKIQSAFVGLIIERATEYDFTHEWLSLHH